MLRGHDCFKQRPEKLKIWPIICVGTSFLWLRIPCCPRSLTPWSAPSCPINPLLARWARTGLDRSSHQLGPGAGGTRKAATAVFHRGEGSTGLTPFFESEKMWKVEETIIQCLWLHHLQGECPSSKAKAAAWNGLASSTTRDPKL